MLAACAAGAHGVDAQIIRPHGQFDLLGFGQHRHRRRRCVDATLGLGRRHALHAVPARLVAQETPRALAFDREDDLLAATNFAGRKLELFDAQPARFEPAAVDAMQVRHEQRGFVATSAGANLDDHLGALVLGLTHQFVEHARLEISTRALELAQVLAGELRHVRVGTLQQGARLVLAPSSRAELLVQVGGALQGATLDARARQALAIAEELGRRQGIRQLRVPVGTLLQSAQGDLGQSQAASSRPWAAPPRAAMAAHPARERAQAFLAYFFWKRSTRPDMSTIFSLPEKNGWHWLQISTARRSSLKQERVVKVLPQAQATLVVR